MVEDGATGSDGRYGCPAERIGHSYYLEIQTKFDKSIMRHCAMAVTTCSRKLSRTVMVLPLALKVHFGVLSKTSHFRQT